MIIDVVIQLGQGGARLQQQPGRKRGGPPALENVVHLGPAFERRNRRVDVGNLAPGDDVLFLGLPVPSPRGGELILGIYLVRQAKTPAINVASLHSGASIEVERIRRLHEGELFAPAHQEPQLVLLDRPAQGAVEVFNFLYGGLTCHAPGSESRVHVAAHKL